MKSYSVNWLIQWLLKLANSKIGRLLDLIGSLDSLYPYGPELTKREG